MIATRAPILREMFQRLVLAREDNMSWKDIKGIWNPQARVEAIVETQQQCYAENQRRYPEQDPTAWLAETLAARLRWSSRAAEHIPFCAPMSLAVDPAVALGLAILQREWPQLASAYRSQFDYQMAPLYKILREGGDLRGAWWAKNPWSGPRYGKEAFLALVELQVTAEKTLHAERRAI